MFNILGLLRKPTISIRAKFFEKFFLVDSQFAADSIRNRIMHSSFKVKGTALYL